MQRLGIVNHQRAFDRAGNGAEHDVNAVRLQEGNTIRAADLDNFKFHIHPPRDFARDIGIKPVNLVAFIEGAEGRQGGVDARAQPAGRQDLIERPCLRRQCCTGGHCSCEREKGTAICRWHCHLLLKFSGVDASRYGATAARWHPGEHSDHQRPTLLQLGGESANQGGRRQVRKLLCIPTLVGIFFKA